MRSVGSSSAVSLVASIVVRHCASTGSSSCTPSDQGLVASPLSTAVSPRTWERRARELARQRPKELDQLIQRELSQFAQPGSGVTLRSQSEERPQNQSKRLNVLISISQSWEQALRLATFSSALQAAPVASGSSSSFSEGGPVMSLAKLTTPARANVIAQLCLAGKHEQVIQLCQLKPSAAAAAGGGASHSAAVPSPQAVAALPTKTRGRQSVRESRLVSRRFRHAIKKLTVLEDVQGLNTLLRIFDAEARPLLHKNNLHQSVPLRSALFGLHYTALLDLATQAVCALLTPQKRLLPLLAAIHAASTLAKLSPGHMLPLSVQRLWAEHYSHIPSSYLRNVDPLLVQSAFRSWTTEAAPGALLLIPSSQFLDLWQKWQQARSSLLTTTKTSGHSSSSPPLTVLESTAILRQVEGATSLTSLSAQQKNDVREVFQNCWDTQDTRVRRCVRKWLLGSCSGRKLCHALRVNMVELLVAPLLSFTTPYNCVSFAARPALPASKTSSANSTELTSSHVPSQQRALSSLLRRLLTPHCVSRYGPSMMGALADQLFVSERTVPDRDRSRLEAHLERDQQRLVSIWKKSCPTKLRFLLILLERELQHCTDRGLTGPCRQRAAYRLFELLRYCDKVSMPLPLEEKTKFGVALFDSGVSFEKIRQWLGAPNPHGCGGNKKKKRCTRSSHEDEDLSRALSAVTDLQTGDETVADYHLNLLRLAAVSNTTRVRRHGLNVSSPNRSQMLALWSLLRCAEVPEVARRKLLSHFICHRPGDPTSDGGLLHALWPCDVRQQLDAQQRARSAMSSLPSSEPRNYSSVEKVVEQRHRQVLVDALYSMSTEPVMRRMLDARPNPQWQRLADAEGIPFLAKHAE